MIVAELKPAHAVVSVLGLMVVMGAGQVQSKPTSGTRSPVTVDVRASNATVGETMQITFPGIEVGGQYDVAFSSGPDATPMVVRSTAARMWDWRSQRFETAIGVQVPVLPPGPTGIQVTDRVDGKLVLVIDGSAVTVHDGPARVSA